MKELVFGEKPPETVTLPPDVIAEFVATRDAVDSRSSIVWGEHCSECAFPACYSNCEFYSPRPDLNCRRFANGIESVRVLNYPDLRGLTRIEFRRWGKLEGSGPPRLEGTKRSDRRARFARTTDEILTALPMPRVISHPVAHRMNVRRAVTGVMPKNAVFVLEAYVDDNTPHATLQLTLMPWSSEIPGMYQASIQLTPGYTREILPVSVILQHTPLDVPFAVRIEMLSEPSLQPILFGLLDFATLRRSLQCIPNAPSSVNASLLKSEVKAKCVIWDLDNTLWKGTLAEDGAEKVAIFPETLEIIRTLDERGIINSVASKNDAPAALAALKAFGIDEYFMFPQIGWGPKSDSVRQIAQSLGIGLDAVVFVDDEPFERAEVVAAHPDVTALSPGDVPSMAHSALFDVPVTEESRTRRAMYRQEQVRTQIAASLGTDYLAFLESSELVLTVSQVSRENVERIYELSQRTNQLNIAGTRMSRDQIRALAEEDTAERGYVLECRDRFGNYGITGFCVMTPSTAKIDGFFMSCRVQRKKVENAFFNWMARGLREAGFQTLSVAYRKTEKNSPALKMLQELGFVYRETSVNEGVLSRVLDTDWPDATVVRVVDQWGNADDGR